MDMHGPHGAARRAENGKNMQEDDRIATAGESDAQALARIARVARNAATRPGATLEAVP